MSGTVTGLDANDRDRIAERVRLLREAKQRKARGLSVPNPGLTQEEMDQVLTRVRTPSPALKTCPSCNGRVNSFNGRCPRCNTAAPTRADAEPVRVEAAAPAAEADTDVWPRCGRCRRRFAPYTGGTGRPATRCPTCRDIQNRAGSKYRKSLVRLAAAVPVAGPLCECGKALRHKGRCIGSQHPRPTKVDLAVSPAPATTPDPEAVRAAEADLGYAHPLSPETCRVVRLTHQGDPELTAIAAALDVLEPLGRAGRARALAYLGVRLGGGEP